MTQPMQPIILDGGQPRFQPNKIVQYLLDTSEAGLHTLTVLQQRGQFSIEDMEQLYQLIGYSVSGFGEIEEFSKEVVAEADRQAEALLAGRRGEDLAQLRALAGVPTQVVPFDVLVATAKAEFSALMAEVQAKVEELAALLAQARAAASAKKETP